MTSLIIPILVAVAICVVMVAGLSSSSVAGFDEGIAAYDSGDYKAALREFRVLARQGDARAQYNLGVMYQTGRGVTQDYQEADRWYRNAAEHGHVEAQFSLGLMYKEGLLGMMYKKGVGVVKNYMKAHKWFNIAASNGHAASKENMGIVASQMTPDDISKAQKLAQEWSEGYAASDKGYLDVLEEALVFREGARAFLGRCSSVQDGRVQIGTKDFLWDAQDGVRVARDIHRRTQSCIDRMFPKALELGWISRAEWELKLRKFEKVDRNTVSRFQSFLIKNGVKTHDISRGVCIMIKMNLDDIAKDTFC